jgi:simple sugar transport system permease protein
LIAAAMAVASVTLGADQIVTALAVNLLAIGGTAYALGEFVPGGVNAGDVPHVEPVAIPLLSSIPIAGPVLFEQSLLTYGAVGLVALTWYVLFHTRWGLGLRAVGQYPRAADTLGVSPWRMQQGALLACGAFGGLAGAVLALQIAGTFTENMSAGRGFIALAAVIFGRWHPVYAGLAALLFGFADALQLRFQVLGIPVSSYFVQMLPYLMALAALVVLGGRAQYAAAIGQAYTRRNK